VYFDANSGTGDSVISANITVKSLDMTGYTGTLTHNESVTLTIAGSGVNFKLASGMTYTLGNEATSAITFTGTSGTTLITTAGKTVGNMTFDGVGGTWQLQDALTATGGTITLTNGTFDTNSQTISAFSLSSDNTNTRTLTLGSSSLTMSASSSPFPWLFNSNGLTVSANTATLTLTGASAYIRSNVGGQSINWNGLSVVFTGGGTMRNNINNTFNNLTITGTAVKTDTFDLSNGGAGGNQTITGTLTS
jgi:hypothetical protein